MNRGTRDTICATIGLLIVIALLTTVAALSDDFLLLSEQFFGRCHSDLLSWLLGDIALLSAP